MVTTKDDLYRYQATVLRWVDGDTVVADVDLGCRVHWRGSVRCAGYDSPEVRGPTRPAGEAATAYVRGLVPAGATVYLDSVDFLPDEQDNFGRMLAAVTLADGRDLAQLMIAAGQAVAYP